MGSRQIQKFASFDYLTFDRPDLLRHAKKAVLQTDSIEFEGQQLMTASATLFTPQYICEVSFESPGVF